MKTVMLYVGCFIAIASVSVYQSCQQTDHIVCYTFENFMVTALDFTYTSPVELHEGDSVYAKKFGFSYQVKAIDTICKKSNWNIMNGAYAFSYQNNSFMKDSIKRIEIFSLQDFNALYPAGTVLNNLFNIPPIVSGSGYSNYYGNMYGGSIQGSEFITLESIPDQTKDFKFYVKTTTNENRVFIDSLPTIKIKI